jgi:osmotically-inducible protein OsmY
LFKGDQFLASISENVQTTVQDGVVTLSGTVPSENARDEIGMRLCKLPGVAHVHNQLAISNR